MSHTNLFWACVAALVFVNCSSTPDKTAESENKTVAAQPVISSFEVLTNAFKDKDGCFLLYDVNKKAYVEEFNPERCRVATPPCSTFKVPLAVMGFDSGVLKDENTKFKWNGKKEVIPEWNQDQTAATWMKYSVIWYSQVITKKLGRAKVQDYLDSMNYGNHDFSGNIETAWLTNGKMPHQKARNSVQITAYQQIDFLKKLFSTTLPQSPNSQELTRKIMYLEKTPQGWDFSGKTGSGFAGIHFDKRLGWFVAHLQKDKQEYLAVVTFTDKVPRQDLIGGKEAKAIMIEALKARGIY